MIVKFHNITVSEKVWKLSAIERLQKNGNKFEIAFLNSHCRFLKAVISRKKKIEPRVLCVTKLQTIFWMWAYSKNTLRNKAVQELGIQKKNYWSKDNETSPGCYGWLGTEVVNGG